VFWRDRGVEIDADERVANACPGLKGECVCRSLSRCGPLQDIALAISCGYRATAETEGRDGSEGGSTCGSVAGNDAGAALCGQMYVFLCSICVTVRAKKGITNKRPICTMSLPSFMFMSAMSFVLLVSVSTPFLHYLLRPLYRSVSV
jgi:hypothetical protein